MKCFVIVMLEINRLSRIYLKQQPLICCFNQPHSVIFGLQRCAGYDVTPGIPLAERSVNMADAHIEGELIEEEVDILTDSGDELEGHVNDTISFGAQPYLFEPEVSDGDGDDPDNEMEVLVEEGAGPRENEWRLDDLSWFVFILFCVYLDTSKAIAYGEGSCYANNDAIGIQCKFSPS